MRAACCLVLLAAACNPRPAPVAEPDRRPTAAEIAEAQSLRIAPIAWLDAAGVAEFRWRDDRGEHFEQGDFELSLRRGADWRVAARLTKVGQRLLWLGASGGTWWRFDLASKPSCLTTGACSAGDGLAGPAASPCEMALLLGLWPLEAQSIGPVAWDASRGAWQATIESLHWWFDRTDLKPIRIASLDAAGGEAGWIDFGEFGRASVPQTSHGNLPLVPMRIRAGAAGGGDVVLFLSRVGSVESDRPRLFDLEALRAALRPEVEERVDGGAP